MDCDVNGLIISIMLASSSIILDARPWLSLPCASLASTALISIVFAVLAARPKLNKPATLSVEDVYSGRANILFFGNFGRLSEEAFVTGMRDIGPMGGAAWGI
ncbi:MAG: Pycsar system effector family protein, partial [Bacteroidota bacterium]